MAQSRPTHVKTIGDIIRHVEANFSDDQALNNYINGKWESLSTHETISAIKRLSCGLLSLGLEKGDKVGILAYSSPEWMTADLAIIMAGGITVPLFHNISDENFVFEVGQSNIRFLFVQGRDQWLTFSRHRNLFETVIGLDEHPEAAGALELNDVYKMGEEKLLQNPEIFDQLCDQQKEDDLMTIIYTSGATGVPKGAEMTHKNLIHLVKSTAFNTGSFERYLSILPLPHVFARQINLIQLAYGTRIYFLNDLHVFTKVCRSIKPTFMIVVPRVLEKTYQGIVEKVNRSNPLIKKIGNWAINLAKRELNWLERVFLKPIANILFYRWIKRLFGGRFKVILCGGAKLDPDLNRFSHAIGFPIFEGWGLTEASTPVVNTPASSKIGTVGKPLPPTEVKIVEKGEILMRGPTIMRGYYRNKAATALALDEEGWFHTGDKGEFDEDGFLKIVGLVKEQYKLSSGEYVVPGRIEVSLAQSPLVDMAMVIGEGHKYASVLIFPDIPVLKQRKKTLNKTNMTDEEFAKTAEIEEEIKKLLNQVNKNLNDWEHMKKFRFIFKKPTVEGGELTPTLKLRRKAILKKYQNIVDDIYRKPNAEAKV